MHNIKAKIISFIERKNKILVAAIICLVVLSGIFYSLSIGNNLRYVDEQKYHKLATNIINHGRYSFDGEHSTAYRPPGYPLILAAFLLLGANIVHLRILNFVVLGLSIYLLHKMLKIHSCLFAAAIGAVLVVCYPVLFYTAGTLYPQTIGAFLFLAIIFLLTGDRMSNGVFILSGLLFGYLVLTIPIFIFILPVFCVWLYRFRKPIWERAVLITCVVTCLLLGAWSIRNYAAFNTFVFISSNSGKNLLLGNSENTTPNAGVNTDISKYRTYAAKLSLDEIERDRYYKSKAIDFAFDHKIRAIELYCQKFLNYFNFRNNLATKAEASLGKDFLMLITYAPLLALFIFRILLIRLHKPSPLEILLITVYLSSGLFYALFFTRIRFRLPFDFLAIGVAAIFLARVFHVAHLKHENFSEPDQKICDQGFC